MKTKLNRENRGFTIIEVMIVLGIAGLILAIVLLAVPALQRSQRNNARRSDAVHIAGLVSDYVSNHGGTLPAAGAFTTTNENCSQLVGGAGNQCNATGVATQAFGTLTAANINLGQVCNPNVNPITWTATPGSFSISFQVEAPGGPQNACIPG